MPVLDDLPPVAAASMWTRKDIKEFKDSLRNDAESVIKVGSGELVTVSMDIIHDICCDCEDLNPLDAGRRYTGFAQNSLRRQKPVYRVFAKFPTAPETAIPGLRKLPNPNGARNRYTGFIF